VLFKLRDYEPFEIRMVGTEVIAGVTYERVLRGGYVKRLQVR
jgi:hypothetical protein